MQKLYLLTGEPATQEASSELRSIHGWGAACLAAVMVTVFSAAWSQTVPAASSTEIDASGRFDSEVQACRTGRTPQAQDTCLREAHAARAERNAGGVAKGGPQLRENALQRCAVFNGEEKNACEARVTGVGTSQGSVGGGGVIRQLETITVPPQEQGQGQGQK